MMRRFRIKEGLDIAVAGAPQQSISEGAKISHVALCGTDYVGLRPKLLVAEGDTVESGQPLLVDKRDPSVPYCAPGTGTVTAINRGARRVLESVVIGLTDSGTSQPLFEPLTDDQLTQLNSNQVRERLQQSGLWTAFRTRPFSRVPLSGSAPRSIFVTAMDTRPLAADPTVVIRQDIAALVAGLRILPVLTQGPIYLCTAPEWDADLPPIERVERVEFFGHHPAGLPGTHIHLLDPVGTQRTVWSIDYQDVIAIGRLFTEGRLEMNRVIALGGDCFENPRLVTTRSGASLNELLANELPGPGALRIISGSVLGGRTSFGHLAFLGRYHKQVTAIRQGGDKHLFGWTGLFPRRYSAAPHVFLGAKDRKEYSFSTSQNGRFTGIIPLRVFERVMPLDILPAPLFRALMVQDTDEAQALGCLELDEEDLALSSFVCPAKSDYGSVLRTNLNRIEKEG